MNKLIALFALIFVSNQISANEFPYPTTVDYKNVTIMFEEQSDKEVTVKIKNVFGEVFYHNEFEVFAGERKTFDLNYLPEGSYTMTINGAQKIVEKSIELNSSNAVVLEEKTFYKPTIVSKENKLWLSHLLLGGSSMVIIRDSDDNELVMEEFAGEGSIQRVYNLDKLAKGTYKFVVLSGGHVFIEGFSI